MFSIPPERPMQLLALLSPPVRRLPQQPHCLPHPCTIALQFLRSENGLEVDRVPGGKRRPSIAWLGHSPSVPPLRINRRPAYPPVHSNTRDPVRIEFSS